MASATKTVRGFTDEYARDMAAAIWDSPEGPVLCCEGAAGGFILYTADEWNATAPADLECDGEGHVTRLGRFVDYDNPAWIVPQDVRKAAIA